MGVTDVALTVIEAMSQHAGSLLPRGQLLCPVTGPGSWLPKDEWILKRVIPVAMMHVSNNSELEGELGSSAELRRKVVIAAVFRRALAFGMRSLGRLMPLSDHPIF